jgi:hypothetical protein
MRTFLPRKQRVWHALIACAVLVPSALSAQGVGLPPLFDTSARRADHAANRGAALSNDAASYGGSVGCACAATLRRQQSVGWDSKRWRLWFCAWPLGQYKPGRWVAVDGAEKALTISGGPIVDLNLRAVDAIGHAYSASVALALVLIPTLPGFTAELSVAPRYELRRLQRAIAKTHTPSEFR